MKIKELIERVLKYFNCEITGSFKFYLQGMLSKYNDIDIITTAEEKPKMTLKFLESQSILKMLMKLKKKL